MCPKRRPFTSSLLFSGSINGQSSYRSLLISRDPTDCNEPECLPAAAADRRVGKEQKFETISSEILRFTFQKARRPRCNWRLCEPFTGAWQRTHIVRFYPARKYVSDSSASDEMMVWFEVANTFRYWTYNFTNFNQRNLRNIFSISF